MAQSSDFSIARQVKGRGKKDTDFVLEISGLMSRSKRLLAEARKEYNDAAKLPAADRAQRQKEAMERAREAKGLAAEAKRLIAKSKKR